MKIDFIAVAAGWAEAEALVAFIVWSIPAMERSVGYLRHMLREAARLGNSVLPDVSGDIVKAIAAQRGDRRASR
jgi:hypothetical protein